MADGIRKSSRPIKIRKEEGFIYDSDSVRFLQDKVNTSDSEVHCPANKDSGKSTTSSSEVNWAEIYKLPLPLSNFENNNHCLISESPVLSEGSGSQCLHPNSSQLIGLEAIVYSSTDSDISGSVRVHNSSTRGDFLDSEDPIWSVSSAVYTDTSDMDQPCVCKSGKLAGVCCY